MSLQIIYLTFRDTVMEQWHQVLLEWEPPPTKLLIIKSEPTEKHIGNYQYKPCLSFYDSLLLDILNIFFKQIFRTLKLYILFLLNS